MFRYIVIRSNKWLSHSVKKSFSNLSINCRISKFLASLIVSLFIKYPNPNMKTNHPRQFDEGKETKEFETRTCEVALTKNR